MVLLKDYPKIATTQGLNKGLSLQQYSFGEFRKYSYTARGHNLNFYVGWAKSFFCPPTSLEKLSLLQQGVYVGCTPLWLP